MAGIYRAWGEDTITGLENAMGTLYLAVAYLKYFSCYIFQNRVSIKCIKFDRNVNLKLIYV